MPTTVSKNELDQLVDLINEYRDRTGASISEIARQAGVGRGMLNLMLTGEYKSSPAVEMCAKIGRVVGFRIKFERYDGE